MIINDMLLKAISWTLVHSLWQGFLLAFFAGLVILFTKKSTSALRYNMLVGLFVVFMVAAGLTFNYELQEEQTETVTRLNLPVQNFNFVAKNSINTADFSQLIIDYLNNNANIIVLIWFLIFSIRCFRIFGDLSHIYRIRNYKTQFPSDFWQNKITELSRRIQLNKTIILLESRLIKVPSVTGFFKPMVLIPVGLLSNLPQDQVEAILLHELAHIKRKDYAINILQSFAEILFFFNPGLLWLSSILRDERENCCDDIAISATESKAKFVHALVSFEEYNIKQNQFAMGFGSNKNHLLNRAKRIINNNNKTLNSIEKTILSISMIFIAVLMIACSNGRISELQLVNSKALTEADRLVQKANSEADQLVIKANKEADELARQADRAASLADKAAAEADSEVKTADAIAAQADVEAAKADADARKDDLQLRKLEAEHKRKEAEMKRLEADGKARAAKSMKTSARTSTTTSTTTTDDGNEHSVVHIKTGITGIDLPEKIEVDQLTKAIISDLISENVIQSNKNLSYKLSNQSLIVNDVVQPESLKNKLSKKYVKSKDISICYNYEVSDKINHKK